ncbi:hypothetical protein EVAR_9707_1 [Eumeta japonica]|uniref:Uncharacterized protein n=1 Tax=Eumeta variegata TaxID=151549 RepID=A0A4C1YUQ5_EUMVA|nr:hypothetical protein EVAR_9707_1 [Eumeta japonica]
MRARNPKNYPEQVQRGRNTPIIANMREIHAAARRGRRWPGGRRRAAAGVKLHLVKRGSFNAGPRSRRAYL